MPDETELTEPVCPSCGTDVVMAQQGGPFGTDIYSCPSCDTRYKYQTPPPADWEPPRTS